ncbi:MAG: murein hydrolase activator EnvC [Flavobacteriales bacterium]
MKLRSMFQTSLRGAIIISTLFIGVAIVSQTQSTKDKSKLEQQRKNIEEKIAYTKKLIARTASSKKKTQNELSALNKQISLRRQLISNYNQDIQSTNVSINKINNQISVMENDISSLKDEYADMLYHAYTNKNSYSKLMYIFASEDFNLAYKRLKYMQQYTEVRKQQAASIIMAQDELTEKIDELEEIKQKSEELVLIQEEEKSTLAYDKSKQQSTLNSLKQEESSLKAEVKKNEKERRKLNQAIQRIIEAELAAERSKTNGAFTLTPAGKVMSENFVKNKGYLAWPVNRGVITSTFGSQPHPSLKGIIVYNNGVDISTDIGSSVKTIFAGKVTSVFSIPGAGFNIIVTHGDYKTVYANLASVSVSEGQEVTLNETIGVVLDQGANTVVHLEVWKVDSTGGTPLNPSSWLKR